MGGHLQTLKCRDKAPITFAMGEPPEQFKLVDGQCSWLGVDDSCGVDELRPRIEPWLTALFQSEHLSLLLGSGLTHAIHHLGTDKPLPGMAAAKFEHFTEVLRTEVERSAKAAVSPRSLPANRGVGRA